MKQGPPRRVRAARDADAPASRAGGKLEAALAHFGLGAAVRGAEVVDVGASTGGFTEALLGQGAATVTAVDVGEGQLHTRLRQDPRVKSHERTDWKTLPLRELPGPFDFFTIDVSFVAARTMLRSLAFRLRPGAQGVVLVKPQFELPPRPLEALARPEVRGRALAVFRKKAEALGFELRGEIDSPVAGRSGTVELLVHLRFRGRPDHLPRPPGEPGSAQAPAGEGPRNRGAEKSERSRRPGRARAVALGGRCRWFAVVAPGLEEVARAEVDRLPGVEAVATVPGGIEWSGPAALGLAANLRLRVASRVLLRLGSARAREFSKMRRLLGKLDFAPVVPADRPVRVVVSTAHCRLYHTKAIAETVLLAMGDRLGAALAAAPAIQPGTEEGGGAGQEAEGTEEGAAPPATRVLVRGQDDVWTVSVDSSGELLHRRGWRLAAGRAPLRETLAAGVLALAGYDPARPLVDAMCGAGTFAIEAAALAANRPPGLQRGFAFEKWPGFDPAIYRPLQAEAAAGQRPVGAPILGWDRDPRVLAHARANAERAGFAAAIAFSEAALGAWPSVAGLPPGLVVVNPPYGKRMAAGGAARALARQLGQGLRAHFLGWRVAVLMPDAGWIRLLGLGKVEMFPLVNGGLRVHLAVGRLGG